MLGTILSTDVSPTVPATGATLIVGTSIAELSPRLPISVEPSGRPVRAPPPVVVGAVDVGLDDVATLLEPEPHGPDNADVVDIPDDVSVDGADAVPGAAAPSDIAAVAADDPTVSPPPSKFEPDPRIPAPEAAKVEHPVPLLGVAIVPFGPGAGLTPGEAIAVAPNGILVPPTGAL